jgi:SAM-dependent methyltransferase
VLAVAVRVVNRLHEELVFARRVRVLATRLATMIDKGARVLDVGCGDGAVTRTLLDLRPDLSVEGVDVLVRPETHIPVTAFDGANLPYRAHSFDNVMFVDVLHHTDDPRSLLTEARRVARSGIVVKDHIVTGPGAVATLRLMDWIGNAHHGVSLPYYYWREERWRQCFDELDLRIERWERSLRLYPVPAHWVFDRRLHMLCRLVAR